jgi:hypothetical protein
MAGHMSAIFCQGMSWHTYLNLEKDLIEIARYVALDKEHSGVWSEKIAQALLLTGSTVDSFFSEMRRSPVLPQSKLLSDLQQNPLPNIGQYREVYEPIYKLSGVEVRASYGLGDYGTIRPFQPFAPQSNPQWWNDYNDVKHGFFQSMDKGTLDNLVHALGALFALNVIHKDSQQYLLSIGIVNVGHFDGKRSFPGGVHDWWQYFKDSFTGFRGFSNFEAWATSEVFTYRFPNVT